MNQMKQLVQGPTDNTKPTLTILQQLVKIAQRSNAGHNLQWETGLCDKKQTKQGKFNKGDNDIYIKYI
jgi:hypothetical protein